MKRKERRKSFKKEPDHQMLNLMNGSSEMSSNDSPNILKNVGKIKIEDLLNLKRIASQNASQKVRKPPQSSPGLNKIRKA
jgi:hypothetical protein